MPNVLKCTNDLKWHRFYETFKFINIMMKNVNNIKNSYCLYKLVINVKV